MTRVANGIATGVLAFDAHIVTVGHWTKNCLQSIILLDSANKYRVPFSFGWPRHSDTDGPSAAVRIGDLGNHR